MNPTKTTKSIIPKKPKGILKHIKKSLDAGKPKVEGPYSIARINNKYIVQKEILIIHEGDDFQVAYDYFLKLVLGKSS